MNGDLNPDHPPQRKSTWIIRLIEAVVIVGVLGGWYAWRLQQVRLNPVSDPRPAAPATAPAARRGPAPALPVDELDRQRHALNDEVTGLLADRNGPRWRALPTPIREVWFDSSGKAWFEAFGAGPGIAYQREAALKEALAGKTHVLYSALPLLIDQKGRFWMDQLNGVRRLDGEGATDITIRPIAANNPPSATEPTTRARRTTRIDRVSLIHIGLEDSRGNCWFIGGGEPGAWQLIRIRPDGGTDQFSIGGEISSNSLPDPSTFMLIERPQGQITLVAPIGSLRPTSPNYSIQELCIYRWNGSALARVVPKACEHEVKYVLPQENGSIKYLCSGGRAWTWWPDDLLDSGKALAAKYVGDLNSREAAVRDAAMRGLLTIGPQIIPSLPPADDPELSADARIRLDSVRLNAEMAARVDERGAHIESVAYDVGLALGMAAPIAKWGDGGVVLHALNVRQIATGRVDRQALVWIDKQGRCTVRPANDAWSYVNLNSSATSSVAFEEGDVITAGIMFSFGLPYPSGRDFRANGDVLRATPPGLEPWKFIGQDGEGRAYADSRDRMIFLDRQKPRLIWTQLADHGDGIVPVPGVRRGWTYLPDSKQPPRIRALGPAGFSDLPPVADMPIAIKMLPLGGNAVICEASDHIPGRPMFFDGNQWHSASSVRELVRENIAAIQPLAPRTFKPSDRGSSLAGHEGGGLWLILRPTRTPNRREPADGEENAIEYYDGARWHNVVEDVWKTVPDFAGEALCTADTGRALVLTDPPNRRVLWVTYDSGTAKVVQCPTTPSIPFVNNMACVPDLSGGVWVGLSSTDGQMHFLRGSVADEVRRSVAPLLLDSRGRVWFADFGREMLMAKVGETWLELPTTHLDRGSRMFQGPDGRLWLCRYDSLSLIEVADPPALTIQEKGNWRWDGPKDSFENAFIDDSNGLWIDGGSRTVARYSLPTGPKTP